MRYAYLFWGLLAGAVAALAGSLVLWGSWLLPVLGLLLTRVALLHGFIAMLIMGALGGVLYAAVIRERRLRLYTAVLVGIVLGVILWVLGPLLLVPVMLGFSHQLNRPMDHWLPLTAFVLYGVLVSLLYSRWGLKQTRSRIYYAGALLLAAGFLTPLLLRAAVSTEAEALDLPEGYRAEVVAKGFTYPTGIALDEDGSIYVAEAGFAYGPKTADGRILRVDPAGRVQEVAGDFNGPVNGITLHRGRLYVSHRGKITVLDPGNAGEREDLVTGLPSLGDHQNNDLLFGPDGALYFGQGTATNAGVVGADNFVYAWVQDHPGFHDLPSRDFVLTGENYESPDPGSLDPAATRATGAFAPFGEIRDKGEMVKGVVPASGAVHRLDPETGELSIFADGLRNPFGLAADEAGNIYATNLGYDDRGVRAVKNSPDWLVQLRQEAWYGWPDFAGDIPLTEPLFASDRGVNRRLLLVNPPAVQAPLATFPPHYSPMKLAVAPAGFPDDGIYVAAFGDGQPLTGDLDQLVPSGVLRVDPASGRFDWFVKNKELPRAGRTGGGFKRVIDVKFAPGEQAMYILDFGVMEFTDMAPNAIPRTGVLWKITPTAGPD